ncbi:MAG: lytic transglycosylase domain-containing protein [Alphaproteobacteria bacterium]|nr:lytic transglycosylase domain-containing protein [Alphaproteobacteria bacterium]
MRTVLLRSGFLTHALLCGAVAGVFLLTLASFTPSFAKPEDDREEVALGLLSTADLGTYTRAFAEAKKKRWKKALVLSALARNPIPAEVIHWLYYTRPGTAASFDEIATFLRQHPDWPNQRLLRLRTEEAMTGGLADEIVLAWFADYPPVTTRGHVLLGEAMLRGEDHDAAEAYLRKTWIERNFTRHEERRFLAKHRKLLEKTDHEQRTDRLLWDGRHWEARRMLYRIDPDQRNLAIARISLMKRSWAVDKDVQRVPKHLTAHPGLMYERLRWRRRKGKIESAREILEHPPAELVRPERWWDERVVVVRRLFRDGYYSEAYRLASEHGQTEGESFAEAEWLSGWIALRFLNDNQVAFTHFTNIYRASRYPISRARGAYWAARAAQAMDARSTQNRWFRIASQYLTTYYGQLAAEHVSGQRPIALPQQIAPSQATVKALEANPLTEVVRLLQEIGAKEHIRPFVLQLAKQADSKEAYAWLADFTLSLDRPDLAVKVTKRAQRQNIPLFVRGYPILNLPNDGPEPALVLAVTRQESAMDKSAVSSAGARGLMQVLPRTARSVSRSLRIRYSRKKLLSDPDYNLRIGSAYLNGLLAEFDGSYVLALAAYNAGPTRVRRWVREIGHPRELGADAIDWVESIPIYETRNYVQRILENLQIYRVRTSGGKFVLQPSNDLQR